MIRKITSNDFSSVYEMGQKYISNFQSVYSLEKYLDDDIYLIYVFEEDKIIKGFVICTKIDNLGEIQIIYVDKKWRNYGIAYRLLKKVEEECQSIILEVAENNLSALNLYKKLDYQKISVRPKYYSGIDAIVMKKVIK